MTTKPPPTSPARGMAISFPIFSIPAGDDLYLFEGAWAVHTKVRHMALAFACVDRPGVWAPDTDAMGDEYRTDPATNTKVVEATTGFPLRQIGGIVDPLAEEFTAMMTRVGDPNLRTPVQLIGDINDVNLGSDWPANFPTTINRAGNQLVMANTPYPVVDDDGHLVGRVDGHRYYTLDMGYKPIDLYWAFADNALVGVDPGTARVEFLLGALR